MVRVAYVWLGLHPTSPQISPLIPTRPKTIVTPLPLPAQASIVRLNLKEARDQLARRLAEVSPDVSVDETIASATREASILLDEVCGRVGLQGEGRVLLAVLVQPSRMEPPFHLAGARPTQVVKA